MTMSKSVSSYLELVTLMEKLRAENGCPWDRQQTPESLKPYLLEETYEVLHALDGKDPVQICEELGDLLLQIVFLAQIFREKGDFSIEDVARGITEKLIRRHPHVFAGAPYADLEDLSRQWNRIKEKEKSSLSQATPCQSEIPSTLPALMRAHKLTRRNIVGQNRETIEQLERAFALDEVTLGEEQERLLAEILCALVAWAERQGIDSEQALRRYLLRNEQEG